MCTCCYVLLPRLSQPLLLLPATPPLTVTYSVTGATGGVLFVPFPPFYLFNKMNTIQTVKEQHKRCQSLNEICLP